MNENYGEQIKNYRINLGMTQNQVAKEPDYKKSSIDNALWAVIQTLDGEQKEKLIKTIKLWQA